MKMSSIKMHKRTFDFGDGSPFEAWKNIASEYSSVFTEFPKAKTVSTIKPKQNDEFIYDKGCALDLQTSYGQSFTKHPQATRHAVRIPSIANLGSGDRAEALSLLTTYHDAFPAKSTAIPQLCLPNPPQSIVLEDARQKIPPESETSRVILPMRIETQPSFSTTTSSSYKNPKTCVKLVPIIQKEEIKKSKSSMQLESTQRVDFTPKEITQQKAFLKVPKENKDCWHFFEKPLNCNPTSTSKDEYKAYGVKLHRPKSFKPASAPISLSSEPFPCLSVYREDFVKLPDNIRSSCAPARRRRSSLKLDDEPTDSSQSHYQESFLRRSDEAFVKPTRCYQGTSDLFKSTTKFGGDTSYGITYRQFTPEEINKVRNILRKKEFQKSEEKFGGETTTNSHFRWQYTPPRKMIKPIVKEKIDFAVPV